MIYLKNTLAMWVCNFIPQILVSLLLAVWLTDNIVKLKAQGAYKIIIYLPSIITAASVSVLFNAMFSQYGPITQSLRNMGIISQKFNFMTSVGGTRGLISFILFWMWYGNTTLLLISGVLGIDPSLYEAADIDGATFWDKLFYITIPMVKQIILFCTITSTIGTLQLFDEPFILTEGGPNYATITMGQYLYNNGFRYLKFGYASAIGYVMTVIIALLSVFQFKATKEKE